MPTEGDFIDNAQPVAEQVALERERAVATQETYLGLWGCADDGSLQYLVGYRRSQLLVEMPDDATAFAIYRMVDGSWSFNSGSANVDHDVLLARFSEGGSYHEAAPSGLVAELSPDR